MQLKSYNKDSKYNHEEEDIDEFRTYPGASGTSTKRLISQTLRGYKRSLIIIALLAVTVLIVGVILYSTISTRNGTPIPTKNSSNTSEPVNRVRVKQPSRWIPFASNPIVPDAEHISEIGTVFDLSVFFDSQKNKYVMIGSWRPRSGLSYSTSVDGFKWDQNLSISLEGRGGGYWDFMVNRPSNVIQTSEGELTIFFTGQDPGGGKIGIARSFDGGVNYIRVQDEPVMIADLEWERHDAVMTPYVLELGNGILRMYYSGGESHEPDAIGVAHSYDGGINWQKNEKPIFVPDPTSDYDNFKVTSPHIVYHEGWYYLFYCGFKDMDHASVNLARSQDGLTKWERSLQNPIVSPTLNTWNCDAVYKPFAIYNDKVNQWLVYYNGRCGSPESIGVSTLNDTSFGNFTERVW